MHWQLGGNFEPVRMVCELDWRQCPAAVGNYIWTEVVTDVLECLTTEGLIWRVLAMLAVCAILVHAFHSKARCHEVSAANRRCLNRVGCKVHDLELKVNVLTYKMQYGTWPLPHQVRSATFRKEMRDVRLTLSSSDHRNAWIKQFLLSPLRNGTCISYTKLDPSSSKHFNNFLDMETGIQSSDTQREISVIDCSASKSSKTSIEKEYPRGSQRCGWETSGKTSTRPHRGISTSENSALGKSRRERGESPSRPTSRRRRRRGAAVARPRTTDEGGERSRDVRNVDRSRGFASSVEEVSDGSSIRAERNNPQTILRASREITDILREAEMGGNCRGKSAKERKRGMSKHREDIADPVESSENDRNAANVDVATPRSMAGRRRVLPPSLNITFHAKMFPRDPSIEELASILASSSPKPLDAATTSRDTLHQVRRRLESLQDVLRSYEAQERRSSALRSCARSGRNEEKARSVCRSVAATLRSIREEIDRVYESRSSALTLELEREEREVTSGRSEAERRARTICCRLEKRSKETRNRVDQRWREDAELEVNVGTNGIHCGREYRGFYGTGCSAKAINENVAYGRNEINQRFVQGRDELGYDDDCSPFDLLASPINFERDDARPGTDGEKRATQDDACPDDSADFQAEDSGTADIFLEDLPSISTRSYETDKRYLQTCFDPDFDRLDDSDIVEIARTATRMPRIREDNVGEFRGGEAEVGRTTERMELEFSTDSCDSGGIWRTVPLLQDLREECPGESSSRNTGRSSEGPRRTDRLGDEVSMYPVPMETDEDAISLSRDSSQSDGVKTSKILPGESPRSTREPATREDQQATKLLQEDRADPAGNPEEESRGNRSPGKLLEKVKPGIDAGDGLENVRVTRKDTAQETIAKTKNINELVRQSVKCIKEYTEIFSMDQNRTFTETRKVIEQHNEMEIIESAKSNVNSDDRRATSDIDLGNSVNREFPVTKTPEDEQTSYENFPKDLNELQRIDKNARKEEIRGDGLSSFESLTNIRRNPAKPAERNLNLNLKRHRGMFSITEETSPRRIEEKLSMHVFEKLGTCDYEQKGVKRKRIDRDDIDLIHRSLKVNDSNQGNTLNFNSEGDKRNEENNSINSAKKKNNTQLDNSRFFIFANNNEITEVDKDCNSFLENKTTELPGICQIKIGDATGQQEEDYPMNLSTVKSKTIPESFSSNMNTSSTTSGSYMDASSHDLITSKNAKLRNNFGIAPDLDKDPSRTNLPAGRARRDAPGSRGIRSNSSLTYGRLESSLEASSRPSRSNVATTTTQRRSRSYVTPRETESSPRNASTTSSASPSGPSGGQVKSSKCDSRRQTTTRRETRETVPSSPGKIESSQQTSKDEEVCINKNQQDFWNPGKVESCQQTLKDEEVCINKNEQDFWNPGKVESCQQTLKDEEVCINKNEQDFWNPGNVESCQQTLKDEGIYVNSNEQTQQEVSFSENGGSALNRDNHESLATHVTSGREENEDQIDVNLRKSESSPQQSTRRSHEDSRRPGSQNSAITTRQLSLGRCQTKANLVEGGNQSVEGRLKSRTPSRSQIPVLKVASKSSTPILKGRLDSAKRHDRKHEDTRPRSPARGPLTMTVMWNESGRIVDVDRKENAVSPEVADLSKEISFTKEQIVKERATKETQSDRDGVINEVQNHEDIVQVNASQIAAGNEAGKNNSAKSSQANAQIVVETVQTNKDCQSGMNEGSFANVLRLNGVEKDENDAREKKLDKELTIDLTQQRKAENQKDSFEEVPRITSRERMVIYINILTKHDDNVTRIVDPRKFMACVKDRETRVASASVASGDSLPIIRTINASIDEERTASGIAGHFLDTEELRKAVVRSSWPVRGKKETDVTAKPSVTETSTSISDLQPGTEILRTAEGFQVFGVPKELSNDEYVVLLEALSHESNVMHFREIRKLCNRLETRAQ